MNVLKFFALLLLISHYTVAQEGTGMLCVAARIDDPFWKESTTPPNGKINSHGLQFRIDKRPVVAWPERKGLKIDGLDTAERHLVSVLDSKGKPIESVWFKFSEFKSTNVCMAYDGYQGIGLQDLTRRTPWCKCH
jgi:hypothetical protein